MADASQFRYYTIQASVYTSSPTSFSASHFLSVVLGQYSARYDGNVQSLPLGPDTLEIIPRVIVESSDGQWKVQAGPARIDSFWTRRRADEQPQQILERLVEVLLAYVDTVPAKVNRLALVTSRFYLANEPQKVLIEQFCNDFARQGPLRNSVTFELHNHKVYLPEHIGMKINSWVRCKTGILHEGEPDTDQYQELGKAVVAEQDLNTLTEEQEGRAVNTMGCKAFFESALAEAEDILGVYFPIEVQS